LVSFESREEFSAQRIIHRLTVTPAVIEQASCHADVRAIEMDGPSTAARANNSHTPSATTIWLSPE